MPRFLTAEEKEERNQGAKRMSKKSLGAHEARRIFNTGQV
jgi:hypothetical protein